MSDLSKTFSDFFGPADENNRTELDNDIRKAEKQRREREKQEQEQAKSLWLSYHQKPFPLTDEHRYLLIDWGYAHFTGHTETGFGRFVIKPLDK